MSKIQDKSGSSGSNKNSDNSKDGKDSKNSKNKGVDELEKEFKKKYAYRNRSRYIYNPNLKGRHPRFNKKLYEKYDIPARDRLKEVLGDFIIDNPNPYEQDLIIVSPTCKYKFLEIQVCSKWWVEYPFPYVFLHERKAKYGEDTLFLTLNRTLSEGYLFDRKSMKGIEPRRMKKYSREYVYDIPWNKVIHVYLKNLDKETFEFY